MADSKLSLTVRKNLRDNEEKLKEFMGRINSAVGKTWTFEADIAKIISDPKISKDHADRIGEILYSSYMEYVAQCIEENCKDDMTKEGLLGSVSANKIIYRLNPKAKGYNEFVIENGALILQCTPENMWCNIYEISSYKLDPILDYDKSKLSLVFRKNMRDYEEKLQTHLNTIKEATGKDWTFEVDMKTIAGNKKIDSSYQDRPGEILYDSYMERIAQCISDNCKDDMTKEALLEAVSKNKVIFRFVDKTDDYHEWKIEGGALILQCKPENFWVNLSDIGYAKLDKLL